MRTRPRRRGLQLVVVNYIANKLNADVSIHKISLSDEFIYKSLPASSADTTCCRGSTQGSRRKSLSDDKKLHQLHEKEAVMHDIVDLVMKDHREFAELFDRLAPIIHEST
jgi:hypothetical protein